MNKGINLTKHDLLPFTCIKTQNGNVGVIIRYNDADIVCFKNCILFLHAYNDDLSLKERITLINPTTDKVIVQYYNNLLDIEDYSGYSIVDSIEIKNFNTIHTMINFDQIIENLLKLKDYSYYNYSLFFV